LDDHIGYIAKMVDKSCRDGETRRLAAAIVSGAYDYSRDPRTGASVPIVEAWGHKFRAPPGDGCKARDSACEIGKIWDFLVINVRYTEDPTDYDTFQTLRETLLMGGGDCDCAVVSFGALLKSLGYRVAARVISTKDAPRDFVHVYPLVGLPKENPTQWVPLDITVDGSYPGWQYARIGKARDYKI